MNYFFKALQIMGIVSEWSTKALEDGVVTGQEGYDLIDRICKILGVKVEIKTFE